MASSRPSKPMTDPTDAERVAAYLRSPQHPKPMPTVRPSMIALASCNARVLRWLRYLATNHPDGLLILRYRMARKMGFPLTELSSDLNTKRELDWLWQTERVSVENWDKTP